MARNTFSSLVLLLASLSRTLARPSSSPFALALKELEVRQDANSSVADISLMVDRRLDVIIEAVTGATSVETWISSLNSSGQWPDVNYQAGCGAQEGTWPAEEHWERLVTLSAAYHGPLKSATQYQDNSTLLATISSAMEYWFGNDFAANPLCLDYGGVSPQCPCGTPGLWNQNWYDNIIGVPAYVGEVCLLLNSTLTSTQLGNCTLFTSRAYATFQTGIYDVSGITGSNALDIASVGIDGALLVGNATQLSGAFDQVHLQMVIEIPPRSDGIRPDGSFGQHEGMLYNGNYGKDFTNDVMWDEIVVGGTQYQANNVSRSAFEILMDANRWMIFRNTVTNVLHWDFSVLGRFLVYAVADFQATENTKMNITQIEVLGEEWDSDVILSVYDSLTLNTTDANSGEIIGNRMFANNDYMVQRGDGYVTSLKLFSNRTLNSECTDAENPYGFHLSDGTLYTYLKGNEYEDIFAAWDWQLVPGITVDYNATVLSCADTSYYGIETFAGGVSEGLNGRGVAAMRYLNPMTKSLAWQKAWFFLDDDVEVVMISNITSTTDAPIFSVLDQRLHVGDVYLDGSVAANGNHSNFSSLWHGSVGYTFPPTTAVDLSLDVGNFTGNWATLGTSKQGLETVDLFRAWLSHTNLSTPISYSIYPATDLAAFQSKSASSNVTILSNTESVSAVYDVSNSLAMIVFWETGGGAVRIPVEGESGTTAATTVSANAPVTVIVRTDTWNVTVSDPSQSLSNVELAFSSLAAGSGIGQTLTFELPSGAGAGTSVWQVLSASDS